MCRKKSSPASRSAVSASAPAPLEDDGSSRRSLAQRLNRRAAAAGGVGRDEDIRTDYRIDNHGENNISQQRITRSDRKAGKTFPLKYIWTFWAIDWKKDWQDALSEVGPVSSVHEFWQMINHMKPPSQVDRFTYNLFKENIRPEWEDLKNEKGGRWNICESLKGAECDAVCLELMLLAIGNSQLAGRLADALCGVYVTPKRDGHRVSLWLDTTDEQRVMAVGRVVQDTLAKHLHRFRGQRRLKLEFTESRPANGGSRGRKASLYHLN